MRTGQITQMIEDAIEDERRTGRLAQTLRAVAEENGKEPNDKEIRSAVDFVREYMQHVPYYLEEGVTAAARAGLGTEMNQIAKELEAYWLEVDDVIPDNLGLIGLMDDAYASLALLQALSDYCEAECGRPLLHRPMTQANQAIRQMIGEPARSLLDLRVKMTLSQALTQRIASQMGAQSAFSLGGGQDPYWGTDTIADVVNSRLGAMGLV